MSRIHPQARALLDELDGYPLPGSRHFDLARSRRDTDLFAPPRVDAQVDGVEDLRIAGVPCRLYRPAPRAPVVVHLHGGGFVEGGLDSHDAVCHLLAASSGWAVLAVDYRLAPEHPYPAALLDAEAVIERVRCLGAELSVDPSRICVLGDSAGGNLVAALTLRARRRAETFALQVLVYPSLGSPIRLPSQDEFATGYALTDEAVSWYLRAYGSSAAADEIDLRPGLSESLHDLPPAVVITAELDPLRDEAELYAARLADAGVPVVCTRTLGMVHGFWRRPATIDAARATIGFVAQTLRQTPDPWC